MKTEYQGIAFTDNDVINKDSFIPRGEYNPHNIRPWLLHEHGFTIAVVFASTLQDALDEVADAGKLDSWRIDITDSVERQDYMVPIASEGEADYVDDDGGRWNWHNYEPTLLGNAGEPFDIDTIDAIELPNPSFSFVALFVAQPESR